MSKAPRTIRLHGPLRLAFEPISRRRMLVQSYDQAALTGSLDRRLGRYYPTLLLHVLRGDRLRYDAFDTIILGENPLLNTLAALKLTRRGLRVLLLNQPATVPDCWPYIIAAWPETGALVNRLVGNTRALTDPEAMASRMAGDIELNRYLNERGISASERGTGGPDATGEPGLANGMRAFFRYASSRIEWSLIRQIKSPLAIRLAARDEADLLLRLTPPDAVEPATDGTADPLKQEMARHWAGIRDRIDRIELEPAADNMVLSHRLLVTAPSFGFTTANPEMLPRHAEDQTIFVTEAGSPAAADGTDSDKTGGYATPIEAALHDLITLGKLC